MRILTACAIALAGYASALMVAPGDADAQTTSTLAAGGSYVGPSQNWAECRVYNASFARAATIVNNRIVRQNGSLATLLVDTCNVIAPNKSCVIAASIGNGESVSCRMVISGSKADLRGNFAVGVKLRSDFTVLINQPLE